MWAWMWCGCGAEEGVRPWQIVLGSIFQGFWPLAGGLEAFEFGMLGLPRFSQGGCGSWKKQKLFCLVRLRARTDAHHEVGTNNCLECLSACVPGQPGARHLAPTSVNEACKCQKRPIVRANEAYF